MVADLAEGEVGEGIEFARVDICDEGRDLAKLAIRCVTIALGLFDTRLFSTVTPEMRAALEASVPHPSRLGRPEEFASLVLQIVANSMLNGDVLRLDGALRMGPR